MVPARRVALLEARHRTCCPSVINQLCLLQRGLNLCEDLIDVERRLIYAQSGVQSPRFASNLNRQLECVAQPHEFRSCGRTACCPLSSSSEPVTEAGRPPSLFVVATFRAKSYSLLLDTLIGMLTHLDQSCVGNSVIFYQIKQHQSPTRDVLVFVNSTNTTSLARWLPARCTAQQGTQPILTSDC